MPANLVPSNAQTAPVTPYQGGGAPAWGAPPPDSGSVNLTEHLTRTLAAFRRYKWLAFAIVAVGSSVGYGLTRFVSPMYEVNANIWVAENQSASGPISSPGLISNALSWPELSRSFIVLDGVVAKLALYVQPANLADTLVVRNLLPSDSLRTGPYALKIDSSGTRFTLVRRAERRGQQESVVEKGAVGDSIGRGVGFLWQPPAAALSAGREIHFTVITPREASVSLGKRLYVFLPDRSNLMRLSLTGNNAAVLAATMNALLHRFLQEAARLKKENLRAVAAIVDSQRVLASQQLQNAESAFETFKINTITMPSENTPVAPGVSLAMNPVFNAYFAENIAYKNTVRDREALETILNEASARGGPISIEALKTLQSVVTNNAQLSTEIVNLEKKQTDLRQLLTKYTDEYGDVKTTKQQIENLQNKTIPSLAQLSLTQLRRQEAEMKRRIDGASQDLKQIPSRTIEETRRAREVDVAARIFTDLQTRTVGARLAEMSALPDIAILDSAVAPSQPSKDTAPGILLVAIAGSVGLALGLALLLDRVDKRFRYPEQATNQLGLDVVGAIPSLRNPRNTSARLQEASQLVEAFRSLSLSVRSAFDGLGPVQFTISSPGPGDGKSFISANLASALADGGSRTLLIDGDIRRGALHSVFAPMEQAPGLLEYLAGSATLSEVIRATGHGNLFVLPTGARRRHGPELLASDAMVGLIRELRDQFDAIVVDSAPLAAGIDPFALGVATGAMLIVLRTGETDRRLAQAKLEVVDRMPVRILGAVLNDIGENPQFKYYQYYLEGYESSDGEEHARIGAGNGAARST